MPPKRYHQTPQQQNTDGAGLGLALVVGAGIVACSAVVRAKRNAQTRKKSLADLPTLYHEMMEATCRAAAAITRSASSANPEDDADYIYWMQHNWECSSVALWVCLVSAMGPTHPHQ